MKDIHCDSWDNYKLSVKERVVSDKIPVRHDNLSIVSKKLGNCQKDKVLCSSEQENPRFEIIKSTKHCLSSPSRREVRSVSCRMVLDLHCHKLDSLHDTLLNFCVKCSLKKEKVLMIITGKGSGIIRQATEEWLNNNPSVIMKYSRIHDSSGGYGSFYVWIRRKGIMLYN